jgi:hypothetical protein
MVQSLKARFKTVCYITVHYTTVQMYKSTKVRFKAVKRYITLHGSKRTLLNGTDKNGTLLQNDTALQNDTLSYRNGLFWS